MRRWKKATSTSDEKHIVWQHGDETLSFLLFPICTLPVNAITWAWSAAVEREGQLKRWGEPPANMLVNYSRAARRTKENLKTGKQPNRLQKYQISSEYLSNNYHILRVFEN